MDCLIWNISIFILLLLLLLLFLFSSHGIVCILGISMNASKNVLLLFAADLFRILIVNYISAVGCTMCGWD